MGSFWLLKLALHCIDLLSWPLLALGYPLCGKRCASIQAIESDSHSDTRNLISYWILLSLIYLFEYAFGKLLQWFHYWPYMKLMIITWLVIPDFGRASYAYNCLLHSCNSMNPQEVISRFGNWKKVFVKKENFITQVEKYIKENGTEALENLIASKNTAQNLNTESEKAVPATEKNEMQQVKFWQNLNTESIKAVPATEKNEMQQVKFWQNLNTESIKAVPATEKNEMQQVKFWQNLDTESIKAVPATEKKEMQQTNKVLLHIEQKDIKDLEMIVKKEVVPEAKQGNKASCSLKLNENTSSAVVETKGTSGKDTAGGESSQISASQKVQKEWTCAMCQVTTTCETNLNSHFHGRKHRAVCEALKQKTQSFQVKKNDKSNEDKPKKMMDTANAFKQKITTDQQVKKEQKNGQISNVQEYVKLKWEHEKKKLGDTPKQQTIKDQENKNKGVHANTKVQESQKIIGMNISKFRCEICNVKCTSEGDMASHLNGRRHLDQIRMGR